jgi:hypothetical protein
MDNETAKNPLTVFEYALKSPESKRQYPKRLKVFLDFLKIDGDLEKQTMTFVATAKNEAKWARVNFVRLLEPDHNYVIDVTTTII